MSAPAGFPRIFVFRSGQNPRLFGFTRDRAGSNLPGGLGPWEDTDAVPPLITDLILDMVEARGFFLARADGMAW